MTEPSASRGGPSPEQIATDAGGRRLLTSTGALVASRLVVAVLGWAGTILIVRALSPEQWGQFSLVFTVLGTLSFMTSLGSGRVVLAELARRSPGGGDYAGTYIVLRLALGLLAYGCAVGFVAVAGYPPVVLQATALGGVVLFIGAGGSGLDVVFQSALRLTPVAIGTVIGQVGQLALTVLVALTRPTLLLFVLPAIAFDSLAAAYKARKVRTLLPLSFRVDLRLWRSILVQAAPLAAGSACVTIGLSVDLLLLSKVDDFAAVGALAVADKFALVVAFVPQALEPPLVALLARTWPGRPAIFFATVRRGTLLMSLCGGLILVAFLPIAGDVVTLLYGDQYDTATLAAQLSVLAGCLQFYSYVLLGALIAQGRNRDFLLLSVTGLGVAIVASAVFVPTLSVTGAGIARVVTALVMLMVFLVVTRRRMAGRVADGRRHLLLALCSGVGLGVGVLGESLIWWPLSMTLAVAVYVGLVELFKVPGPAGLRSLLHDDEPLAPVDGEATDGTTS